LCCIKLGILGLDEIFFGIYNRMPLIFVRVYNSTMKLTRTLFVVTLCFWGLLSISGLLLPQHDDPGVDSTFHVKSHIVYSFDLQNVLAGEEVEDDIRSKNHLSHAVGLVGSFVRVGESESLEDQGNIPPTNALKVFSLYHQFF